MWDTYLYLVPWTLSVIWLVVGYIDGLLISYFTFKCFNYEK